MSYREPRTGRLLDDQRQYTPSQRDIRRANARREIERRKDELRTEREYDPEYYLFEEDE